MIKVKILKIEEWHSGHAYMIADELEKTFRSTDMYSKADEKTKLGQLKYKKGHNPDNFSTAMKGLQVEYRNKFNKKGKIAALVSAIGPCYEETIVKEMEKLKSAEEKYVTCDVVVENLCKVWWTIGSGRVL